MRRAALFMFIVFPLIAEEPLTNADVVKLVKAGLSAETIEAKIAGSATSFDTSTDALVALAEAGVPDRVIQVMLARVPPASSRPPVPPPTEGRLEAGGTRAFPVRRYDVAIHRDEHARCDGGELRIDARGVKASRCRKLDFDLPWDKIKSVCYEYGFRGTVVFVTGDGEHRISTVTPAEAKRIVDHVRGMKSIPTAKCEGSAPGESGQNFSDILAVPYLPSARNYRG
jgi:hypothetical protein